MAAPTPPRALPNVDYPRARIQTTPDSHDDDGDDDLSCAGVPDSHTLILVERLRVGARARLFPEKGRISSFVVFLFIFSGEYFLVLLLSQHTRTRTWGGETVEVVVGNVRKRRRETGKERDSECY